MLACGRLALGRMLRSPRMSEPRSFRWLAGAFALALLPVVVLLFVLNREYVAPTRFEAQIRAFEAGDRVGPPQSGAIVVVGNLDLAVLQDRLAQDLAPLPIVGRAFAGSTLRDLEHYAERIVLAYTPRAVVLHAGEDDVARRVPAEVILERFRALVGTLHARAPELRLYVIALEPKPARVSSWPTLSALNRQLAAECARDRRLVFIDVASPMLQSDGTPRRELFGEDGLQLSDAGYALWRDVIGSVLRARELTEEATPS